MKAMILAAGRSNRMRPLTDSTPKPLLKIGQYSLIEHHLINLAKSGFQEIIINISHLAEQFPQTLGDGSRYNTRIHYSLEPPGALETGGGIYKALPLLGPEPFLVISGDIWTDYPFHQLPHKIEGLTHLVLVDNPPFHPRGDFCLQGKHIQNTGNTRLTFGNIGIYHPDLFKGCTSGVFPLGPLLRQANDKLLATGEYFTGAWQNIGTPEQLQALSPATP